MTQAPRRKPVRVFGGRNTVELDLQSLCGEAYPQDGIYAIQLRVWDFSPEFRARKPEQIATYPISGFTSTGSAKFVIDATVLSAYSTSDRRFYVEAVTTQTADVIFVFDLIVGPALFAKEAIRQPSITQFPQQSTSSIPFIGFDLNPSGP